MGRVQSECDARLDGRTEMPAGRHAVGAKSVLIVNSALNYDRRWTTMRPNQGALKVILQLLAFVPFFWIPLVSSYYAEQIGSSTKISSTPQDNHGRTPLTRWLLTSSLYNYERKIVGSSGRSLKDEDDGGSSTAADYYGDEEEDITVTDDILGEGTSPIKSYTTSSYRGRESNTDSSSTKPHSTSSSSSSHGSSTATHNTASIGSDSSSTYDTSYGSSSTTTKHPYKSPWGEEEDEEEEKDYYSSKSSHKGGFFRGSSSHAFKWRRPKFRPIHYIFGSFFTVVIFFGGATFFTAYQVLEQPQGCYATSCRRSIACYKCILQLCNKGITYFLWGRDERWEGFESCDTDFEEEENLPRLRAGIGRALEREHSRSMKGIPYNNHKKKTNGILSHGLEMT